MSETIAAQFIGGIPGNPATVWASAHAMLEAAQAISIGFDYLQAAGSATPTWTGEASQSFASKVEAGGEKLDTLISALKCGATALEDYAGVLENAKAQAADLRADMDSLIADVKANPTLAATAPAAVFSLTSAYTALVERVKAAALQAAAALGTETDLESASKDKNNTNLQTTELSKSDADRIEEEINDKDSPLNWSENHQGSDIGDCYLLATLYSYSHTSNGQETLRNNVKRIEGTDAFEVTLYDENGSPHKVKAEDYYTYGANNKIDEHIEVPNLMTIYERAYGIYREEKNDDINKGRATDAMETISGGKSKTLDTSDLWFFDDHKYRKSEWEEIEAAVHDGKPVAAGVPSSNGGDVQARVDNDGDGAVDGNSSSYPIVTNHTYSVLSIDDDYVTLRNPQDKNGSHEDGIIRITREDYEKHFSRTYIGATDTSPSGQTPNPSPGPAPTPTKDG